MLVERKRKLVSSRFFENKPKPNELTSGELQHGMHVSIFKSFPPAVNAELLLVRP